MTVFRYVPALALALVTSAAAAQSPRAVPRWPERAWGQAIPLDGVRPTGEVGVLRSWRAPVDVHVMAGVSADDARAVLADAESVMDALEQRTGVALPLPDGDRGGTPSFDIYLWDGRPLPPGHVPSDVRLIRPDIMTVLEGGSMEFRTNIVHESNDLEVDALSYAGPWDRASAFGFVTTAVDPTVQRRRVAQLIAEACIYGAKADHPVGFVRAMGASLAHRATGLPLAPDDVRAFQLDPTLAWWSDDARSPAAQRGAAVVLDAMAARYDNDRGTFLRGLTEAPVQWTPRGWPRFWDEPDAMEVLKRVTRDEPNGFWGALLLAGRDRAVVESPGEERDLAVPPARVVTWSALPAWTTVTGIAPTGQATVELDLSDAPVVGSVGVWVHASPYHRWVATVLRVDRNGHVIGSIDSELITDGEWAARVDSLEDARRLVVVVVSAGDGEMDPDGEPIRDGWVAMNVGRL